MAFIPVITAASLLISLDLLPIVDLTKDGGRADVFVQLSQCRC